MPVTGYIGGGEVVPRRFCKLNSSGKIVHATYADMEPATVGAGPPVGISQPSSRGAAGTPWAQGWSGSVTAVTPLGLPICCILDQEIQVIDGEMDECEMEVATPTAADIDPGAGVLTVGGAIVYGDLLTAGLDGVGYKLAGEGYYGAMALADVALDNTVNNSVLETQFIMVSIRRGYRKA